MRYFNIAVPLENISDEFYNLMMSTHDEIQKGIVKKFRKAPMRYKREILGFMTRLSQKGALRRRSGQLTQSVDVQGFMQGEEYYIKAVSDKEYAMIQHEGGHTRPHIIRANRAKALRWYGGKLTKSGRVSKAKANIHFAKSVRHPGSYIKPKYFFKFPMIKFTDAFIRELIADIKWVEGQVGK